MEDGHGRYSWRRNTWRDKIMALKGPCNLVRENNQRGICMDEYYWGRSIWLRKEMGTDIWRGI